MEAAALLAELRALERDFPDFKNFSASSRAHHQWIWKLRALMSTLDKGEARKLERAVEQLNSPVFIPDGISEIFGVYYRAVHKLEIKVVALPRSSFGPGAVYDFFKTLRDLLGSPKTAVFVIDPYLDDEVFDAYITAITKGVKVRLLAREYGVQLKPAITRFVTQSGMAIEVRTSKALHDRVIFLDDRSCWVLGQSIKDAAKAKPTYLAPLDLDSGSLKKADYERIWSTATAI